MVPITTAMTVEMSPMPMELIRALVKALVFEDSSVVVQGPLLRNELAVLDGSGGLEGQARNPQDWNQRVQQDQKVDDGPADLESGSHGHVSVLPYRIREPKHRKV